METMMDRHIKDLLIRSLDSTLPDRQESELQAALESSAELRAEKEKLLALRSNLVKSTGGAFKEGFTDRVMSRIYPDFSRELIHYFRPVAAVAILLILVLVSINLINTGQINISSALGITEVSPEDAFNPIVDLIRE